MRLFHTADLREINVWYAARSEYGLTATAIPEIGLIEPHIACGFLYRTDAPAIAMLDSFISNPEAPLRARATSIREIALGLMEMAEASGVTHIMALCKSRGIERMADRLGLRPIGMYAVAGKELG